MNIKSVSCSYKQTLTYVFTTRFSIIYNYISWLHVSTVFGWNTWNSHGIPRARTPKDQRNQTWSTHISIDSRKLGKKSIIDYWSIKTCLWEIKSCPCPDLVFIAKHWPLFMALTGCYPLQKGIKHTTYFRNWPPFHRVCLKIVCTFHPLVTKIDAPIKIAITWGLNHPQLTSAINATIHQDLQYPVFHGHVFFWSQIVHRSAPCHICRRQRKS